MTRVLTEWITPVLDRTESDVLRVLALIKLGYENMSDAQKAEWLSDMKGALNRSDLERITNNMILVLGELGDVELDYFVIDTDVVISATDTIVGVISVDDSQLPEDLIEIPELPNQPWYEQLVDIVDYIKSTNYTTAQTPDAPEEPLNHYQKWNDIEKIIADAYSMIRNQIYVYAGGELYGGETIGTYLL